MIRRSLSAVAILLTFVSLSGSARAARFVPIEIYLNGELILEGNASDDGAPDADAVWDQLGKVNLGETDAFQKLPGAQDQDTVVIESKERDARGDPGVLIDVRYGGVAHTAKLRIHRQPPDRAGRVWRIDAEDAADLFSSRFVRRRDVERLSDPERKR
jgi:hypothetical protein